MLTECKLFTVPDCPLCELARCELMPMIEHGLWVERVDISLDAELDERYRDCAPVLRRQDTGAELAWPFEAYQIAAFLGPP
jgi:hypothetical protein